MLQQKLNKIYNKEGLISFLFLKRKEITMVFNPDTEIKLVRCPLSLDNKNQLTFENKQKQFEYFNSLPSLVITGCTYQRKNGTIRIPRKFEQIMTYDYVMYKNTHYMDKWFYAFITDLHYVNDYLSEINIATDVWQTWQFDLHFKQSFVEREMINVSSDIPRS